jgi:hypothetical protein
MAPSYKSGTVFQLGKSTLQCRRHLAMGYPAASAFARVWDQSIDLWRAR